MSPIALSVLITITGPDRPGVSRLALAAVADPTGGPPAQLLDMEQVVVRGQLILSLLLTGTGDDLAPVVEQLAHRLPDFTVTSTAGHGDNTARRPGRASVTVLAESLEAGDVARIVGLIADHGANIDRIRRLSRDPVTTIEFELSGAEIGRLRTDLVLAAHELRLDVAVAPAGLARRGARLVVMDVDSTLIQDEVIELLAAHAGRAEEVAAVTEAAMRGELDFAESLHARVATLDGLPVTVFDEVRAAVRLTPGAERLCRTLRRLGCTIGLVSGGFAEVVEPLAAELGISHVRANRLEVVDGRLTGRVLGPVIDRPAKAAALQEFAAAEGLPLARTVAVGDGANDLDMLAAAGLGVAFNAKPLVRRQARTALNVPYLDAVLYLLGISSDEVDEADAINPSECAR